MKRIGEGLQGMIPVVGTGGPKAEPDRCKTCDGTGWAYVPGGRAVQRCPDCLEQRLGFAPGVPADERETTLDAWERGEREVTDANRPAIRQARFFVQGVHPGLYLHGGVGTGKTALACAVLNEIHKAGKVGVRFVRVTELLKQLVQADSGDQVYATLVDVPVLCLDDIGAQRGTDYASQTIQQVFDARTDRGHRTIWTSNLNLDELAEHQGNDERLASRIAGTCKVVNLEGKDYRLLKARRRAGK